MNTFQTRGATSRLNLLLLPFRAWFARQQIEHHLHRCRAGQGSQPRAGILDNRVLHGTVLEGIETIDVQDPEECGGQLPLARADRLEHPL